MQHVSKPQPSLLEIQAAYGACQGQSAALRPTLVCVYREYIADMDTPLTLLLKLRAHANSGGGAHAHHCFLLESVEGGERLARHSFVGAAPRGVLSFGPGGPPHCSHPPGDPLLALEATLAECRLLRVPGHALPAFCGGAVGYVGYECVRYFEPRVAPLLQAQADVLGIPEALFMLVDSMVVFDHVRHTVKVIAHMRLPQGGGGEGAAASLEAAYAAACAEIEALQLQLAGPTPPAHLLAPPGPISPVRPPRAAGVGAGSSGGGAAGAPPRAAYATPSPSLSTPPRQGPSSTASSSASSTVSSTASSSALAPLPSSTIAWEEHSNVGKAGYEGFVTNLQGHIVEGDIIQAVASQRISRPIPEGSPVTALDMYRQLRILNPSPYMFYLECGEGFTIVGASPEMLVKVEQSGTVTTHPIAGTRPRGATPAADDALAAELLADAKERAEHIMLVDLGRNDIGRVAAPGSVRVDSLMHIERYSHVMHIVSVVTGQLAGWGGQSSSSSSSSSSVVTTTPVRSSFDAFRAVFPAGTVSGAPKVRAIELVAGLEPSRRGVYAGAVGCFGYDGALDTAIAIRTLVVLGDVVHLQAGAGIVYDSQPTAEYEETLAKLKATMRAVEAAIANAAAQ